ncbi:MAG: nicotinate phosphoribosyltransferase, partial [Clostridiales bacterium]|nr:nicotinate phosphoribosyltransferase [Clostridiales bacterium]
FKRVFRLYDNDSGESIADVLTVYDEEVKSGEPIRLFDPRATWKRKTVSNFTAKEIMVPVFRNGKLVYQLPTLKEIQDYCRQQVDMLWNEVKRFDNPHAYYVDLSDQLWNIKEDLLHLTY